MTGEVCAEPIPVCFDIPPRRCEAQRLVDQWRAGQQRAATRLYRLYADDVQRVVRFHLNRRFFIRCDEDDAVQVVFGEVFRRLRDGFDEFETDAAFGRWIRTVARNLTIKLVKHQSAERRALSRESRADDQQSFRNLIDAHSTRAARGGSHEAVSDLRDRVARLDAPLQQVVAMLQANLTQEEIAVRLECTPRTVRRRVRRIRELLSRAA